MVYGITFVPMTVSTRKEGSSMTMPESFEFFIQRDVEILAPEYRIGVGLREFQEVD